MSRSEPPQRTEHREPAGSEGLYRIGEIGRRYGVSPDVLRVWERRYALVSPQRSAGGFRLYSPDDEARVAAMVRNLARGYSASVAARMALASPAGMPFVDQEAILVRARTELGAALESYRDQDAQGVLDHLLEGFSVEVVLRDVVLPYLRSVGDRWEQGELSVAQEHFASAVLRGRLTWLARGLDVGAGPRALLACPSGERHDLGLLCFAIGLNEHGWRVTYLGADTPIDSLCEAAGRLAPDLVVVCAATERPLRAVEGELAEVASRWRLMLAGRGASVEIAHAASAGLLQDAPMAAAARIAGGG